MTVSSKSLNLMLAQNLLAKMDDSAMFDQPIPPCSAEEHHWTVVEDHPHTERFADAAVTGMHPVAVVCEHCGFTVGLQS